MLTITSRTSLEEGDELSLVEYPTHSPIVPSGMSDRDAAMLLSYGDWSNTGRTWVSLVGGASVVDASPEQIEEYIIKQTAVKVARYQATVAGYDAIGGDTVEALAALMVRLGYDIPCDYREVLAEITAALPTMTTDQKTDAVAAGVLYGNLSVSMSDAMIAAVMEYRRAKA